MLHKKQGFEGQKAIVIPRKILREKCSTHSLIKNLYITDIGFYPKAQGHYRERAQGSDQHILIYVLNGKGYVEIKKEKYELNPGDFIFIPAKVSHLYYSDEKVPWSIHWVHFSGPLSHEIIDIMLLHHKSLRAPVDLSDRRAQLFNELYLNLERGYSMENLYYVNMTFQHFLSSFIFNSRFNQVHIDSMEDAVNSSINFMQEHLDKTLSLKTIADKVCLSSSHYTFLFKQKTGFTPIEYFNHLKIQKACQFLLFTDKRVKEIADHVGINDPYYFSRLFTKLMGISPAEYRTRRQT